jgi:hypothetical protein
MNMLGYMEDLTELYNEELNALTLRDMKKFTEIQPAKTRLVMSCEASMNEIQKQPALLKTISPALKERVFMAENTLSQLAQKSQRECQIRAESMRRVQQRLLDAARHLMNKDKNKYNNRGQADFAKVKATATAINEAI